MLVLLIPMVVLVPDARLPKEAIAPFHWGRFWSRLLGRAPSSTPTSPGPGSPGSWCGWGRPWPRSTCCSTCEDFLNYPEPEQGQTTLIGLYGLGTIVTAVIGGRLSDRSGKRKIFVIVASIVMGLSVLILALVPNFTAACIGAFLLGTGYGVYLAVDQALITQVLPTAEDRARDLGRHQHRQHQRRRSSRRCSPRRW